MEIYYPEETPQLFITKDYHNSKITKNALIACQLELQNMCDFSDHLDLLFFSN